MTNNNITHHKAWMVMEIRLDLPSGVNPHDVWEEMDCDEKLQYALDEDFDDYYSALSCYQDLDLPKSYGYCYNTPNGKLYIHYGTALGVCEWWTDGNGNVLDNSWTEQECFFDLNTKFKNKE